MGIVIYFPFGIPQVYLILDPYWYSHLFPICVCRCFTHKIPIWAFSYISHLGSPRFPPYGTHIGINIYFPFGFTQVDPIINPYGHLHMCPTWVFPDFSIILPICALSYISHLGSPRFVPYGTHIGIHIYFPFVFAQGVSI